MSIALMKIVLWEVNKLFNGLEKLGWIFREYYKNERVITYSFYNKNMEEEIEVIVYRDSHDIDFIFDNRMYVRLEIMKAIADIDWKGVEF